MKISTLFLGVGGVGRSLTLNNFFHQRKSRASVVFVVMENGKRKSESFSELKPFDMMVYDYYSQMTFNLFRHKNTLAPTITIVKSRKLIFDNEYSNDISFCLFYFVTYCEKVILINLLDFIHRHAVY